MAHDPGDEPKVDEVLTEEEVPTQAPTPEPPDA